MLRKIKQTHIFQSIAINLASTLRELAKFCLDIIFVLTHWSRHSKTSFSGTFRAHEKSKSALVVLVHFVYFMSLPVQVDLLFA